MKLHILGDLHQEFATFVPTDVDADLIILAGDIHTGRNGLAWARSTFPTVPVLYVLGNHEFYGHEIPNLTEALKAEAAGTNVHVLENDCVEIGGVTFFGASLWTDMALRGDPVLAGLIAEDGMNDFERIRVTPGYTKLRASFVRRLHAESVRWLRRQFAERRGQRMVVITHHAPSARSIPAKFQGHPLNPAFASNLDALVADSGARLWIHGHIHHCSDYMLGDTRVIANTRGYPGEGIADFDPALVIEVRGSQGASVHPQGCFVSIFSPEHA